MKETEEIKTHPIQWIRIVLNAKTVTVVRKGKRHRHHHFQPGWGRPPESWNTTLARISRVTRKDPTLYTEVFNWGMIIFTEAARGRYKSQHGGWKFTS